VSAGLGLSIGSAITVKADVRRGSLVAVPLDPPLQRRLGIIRRRGKVLRPALAAVLAALERFKDRRGPSS